MCPFKYSGNWNMHRNGQLCTVLVVDGALNDVQYIYNKAISHATNVVAITIYVIIDVFAADFIFIN